MADVPSLSLAARGVVDSIGRDLHWAVDASAVTAAAWDATDVSTCSSSDVVDAQSQLFGTDMLRGGLALLGIGAICDHVRQADQIAAPRLYQIGNTGLSRSRSASTMVCSLLEESG